MKYGESFLGRKGFLVSLGVIPIQGTQRGLYFGNYSKGGFDTLKDFTLFSQNILSVAQEWLGGTENIYFRHLLLTKSRHKFDDY